MDKIEKVRSTGAIEVMRQQVEQALSYVAEALSKNLTPPALSTALDSLNEWEQAITAMKDNAKQRLLSLVLSEGEVTTEKGSRRLSIEGWELEARPWRTGFEDKKVEAMLRAKGVDVNKYMDAVLTYKANPTRLQVLVLEGHVTQDELETCRYELKYNLMSPKRARNVEASDE